MKNRKSFLKGALCGALAMLLAAGLVSCGLKVNSGSSDITSKTEDKISELQNLVKKHYMGGGNSTITYSLRFIERIFPSFNLSATSCPK